MPSTVSVAFGTSGKTANALLSSPPRRDHLRGVKGYGIKILSGTAGRENGV